MGSVRWRSDVRRTGCASVVDHGRGDGRRDRGVGLRQAAGRRAWRPEWVRELPVDALPDGRPARRGADPDDRRGRPARPCPCARGPAPRPDELPPPDLQDARALRRASPVPRRALGPRAPDVAQALRRADPSAETELFARVDASDHGPTAARLRCLRGVGQPTAAGLLAEIGDFALQRRAASPRWHYTRRLRARPPPTGRGRLELPLRAAPRQQPPRTPEGPARRRHARAWQTQLRLHNLWRRYDARGKRRTVTAIAVARELAGACWAVALM